MEHLGHELVTIEDVGGTGQRMSLMCHNTGSYIWVLSFVNSWYTPQRFVYFQTFYSTCTPIGYQSYMSTVIAVFCFSFNLC